MPTAWQVALADWELHLRSSGYRNDTVHTRVDTLRRFARHAGVEDPWAAHPEDLLGWCGRQAWAQETRRSITSSLRTFYAWGVDTGRIDVSPATRLPRVKPRAATPRACPDAVYMAAIANTEPRTRAALRIAAEMGLRRGEIARIHSRDFVSSIATGDREVTLAVHGKGGKTRLQPMPGQLALELLAQPSGWLFPSGVDGHLSPEHLGRLATRALEGPWTIHSLRHRFAQRALAQTENLATVQDLLGHASPVTTRIYTPRDDARMRHTVQVLADDDRRRLNTQEAS